MPTISRLKRPAAVLILITAASAAVATGGGGINSGVRAHVPSFANHDLAATAYGGFGYGSTSRGTRIGGFGIFIADQVDDEMVGAKKLVGGFGGNVTGQELVLGPFTLAITAWTGLGGIAAEGLPGSGGYFALYEELDVEGGFAPLPWMQIVGYAGFQVVVSVIPGFFANEAISYTPTLGLRLVWGSFGGSR